MNHLEGGSKDCYKYAYYKLWDNCGSPACFSVGDSCSFSCLHLGKSWCSFFGQKDSGFKSIILDNVKGLAEKKKKRQKKRLTVFMITRASQRLYQMLPDISDTPFEER